MIVTISFICYVLRYLTYNIRLEGNVLKEYGAFLSNPRSIEVSTIKQMLPEEFNHKGLFAHSGRPVQPLAIPYFNILSGETKPFPLYPVNTNLVTTIQQLNPQVNVDSRIQEHIKNFGNSFYANWQYYQSYLIIILASMVTAFLPFVAFVIYTNLGPALIQNF